MSDGRPTETMPGGTGYIRAVHLSKQQRIRCCMKLEDVTGLSWTSFSQNELVRFEAMHLAANVQDQLFTFYPRDRTVMAVMVMTGVAETTGLRATVAIFRRGYATQLLGRSQHSCIVSPCPHSLAPYLLEGGPPAGHDVYPVFQPVFDSKSILAVYYGPGAMQKSLTATLQRSVAISDAVNHASRSSVHIANTMGGAPPPICVVHGGAICAQLWPRYRLRPSATLLVSAPTSVHRRGLFRLAAKTEDAKSIYASAPDADTIISDWHHGVPSYVSEFFYTPPIGTGIKAQFEVTPGKIAELDQGAIVRKLQFETLSLNILEDNLSEITSFVTAGSTDEQAA